MVWFSWMFNRDTPVYCMMLMSILVVDVSLVLPGSDDAGETEDEYAGTDNRETEIVEHHGPGLHHVTHQHGEEFPPQQG